MNSYQNSDEGSPSSAETAGETLPVVKPALGKLWASTATHKVLISFTDFPHRFADDCKEINRTISLFYSRIAAATEPKRIKITSNGVEGY